MKKNIADYSDEILEEASRLVEEGIDYKEAHKKALKEYRIWKAMKSRCYSPSQTNGYYKKDNIQVCERWRNSFENFIEDMGMMPDENYSIERIDYTKDYCPENCKWILQTEQPKNRRNILVM